MSPRKGGGGSATGTRRGAARSARKRPARPRRGRSSERRVFCFGEGRADGRADQRELLGGKGANLAEMSRLGLSVPPGFTLSTAVCRSWGTGRRRPAGLEEEIGAALSRLEVLMGRRFGDAEEPLLVSVRSGARVSMPGMMDSVLNLGLNRKSVPGLAALADECFAWDSYRRFLQMYGDVVLGVPHERFESTLEDLKHARRIRLDTELGARDWRGLAEDFEEIVAEHTGRGFPQDPMKQLWGAIGAVFRSWGNERAVRYRQLHAIPESWGTAVNVQAMVFGNMGDDSATGVAFTRDPSTGVRVFYGEYLRNAQGEDVVAGLRTPQPLNRESRGSEQSSLPTLEEEMPSTYRELLRIQRVLEKHYRDMQDLEFTIERGRLWILQTRAGKRAPTAAVKIAVDMAKERLIRREEAICRVDPASLEQLLHPTLDPRAERRVIARGLPASPGAGVGRAVFSADEAEQLARGGERVILVRVETSPDDIHGMHAAQGILTARGGMTSHAAVVARGMGRCCVVGCDALAVDPKLGRARIGDQTIERGDFLTLDGGCGEVMLGEVATVTPELGGEFVELMSWADRFRRTRVRTNADTPQDAMVARQFGAEGIGLCRTEHMFFEPGRILAMREMILAEDETQRERALEKLLPMQRGDFVGIFRAMEGLPVTVRLLDPPLHEFLPHNDDEIRDLATALGRDAAGVRAQVEARREWNPMLGHRGCRLGITFPSLYRMQTRAIVEAACEVAGSGLAVEPEIMIPLVSHVGELERLRGLVQEEAKRVRKRAGRPRLRVRIGTMIEVPRAALTADAIAREADFFSFGTNDLTQMTWALSRDDVGKFLPTYLETGILEADPFVSIEEEGIGALIAIGIERGRATRPGLKVGICGEHAGDPSSVRFCVRQGIDYVSCSPFRVPVARLAAARAAIEESRA
ncbi:MAG: pyruvate, phosphate dikinase [Myxococcota bacterium]